LGSAVMSDGRDAHIYDGGGWNAGERERESRRGEM
jgi:hypothetical protein